MNALRCVTLRPLTSVGTMKAVIPPRCPSLLGTIAMTMTTSATAPFVAHSLVPLMVYVDPSSDGVAVTESRAGSEPTSGSVSRKALMWVRATFGSHSFFCSSDPNSISGCGRPIDW